MDRDLILFWGITLLLCFLCLVSAKDIWSLIKSAYKRTVDALKWYPYLSYLGVGIDKKKKHKTEGLHDEEGKFQSYHQKPFPRSRRST